MSAPVGGDARRATRNASQKTASGSRNRESPKSVRPVRSTATSINDPGVRVRSRAAWAIAVKPGWTLVGNWGSGKAADTDITR
jgi:hypothetical protein